MSRANLIRSQPSIVCPNGYCFQLQLLTSARPRHWHFGCRVLGYPEPYAADCGLAEYGVLGKRAPSHHLRWHGYSVTGSIYQRLETLNSSIWYSPKLSRLLPVYYGLCTHAHRLRGNHTSCGCRGFRPHFERTSQTAGEHFWSSVPVSCRLW